MKTRILITGLAFVSAISFGQKKELKKAEKAIKSNEYSEALTYLTEAEPLIGAANDEIKAQFYAARGEALLGSGSTDFAKLKGAAEAFGQALSLNPAIEAQIAAPLQNVRAGLVNSARTDYTSQKYLVASDKLYTCYMIDKNELEYLYFAGLYAHEGKDYDKALSYYQILLDAGYTGESKEFVATNKVNGEVEAFENEKLRDFAVKSGEYIKPEVKVLDSRKTDILGNMARIYLEKDETPKAVEILEAARAESPDDVDLMRLEADISNRIGDYDKYDKIMNKIIATDPSNPAIYTNLGVANAELGKKEKAIGYYEKALEIDPNYEAALINISVVKLSYEDAIRETMNNLGTSRADNAKFDTLKKELNEVYRNALPYLEKAYRISPSNVGVVQTLSNIYSQLGEDAKFKEMKAKLDALKAQE